MLTNITYNCDPDSLGDVSQGDFVDAFENEVRADPRFHETKIRVTFHNQTSRVSRASFDKFDGLGGQLAELFRSIAERAFAHCLEGGKS